ncbi:transposase InsO family protein [Bradyrhizobium elkanii]
MPRSWVRSGKSIGTAAAPRRQPRARHGIRAIMAPPRRVRTSDSRHNLPIAPNLIARGFAAPAANRVWLADISYVPTAEGWLTAGMNLLSRKIVSWAIRDEGRTRIRGADDGHPAATAG